ncbi:hypothetical protein EG829_25955 [bacterium]|nr:hypothetical protein [bacterium]
MSWLSRVFTRYSLFARLFAGHSAFWDNLAGDEQRHADLLETLRKEPDLQTLLLLDPRLKSQAITLSIEYVERRIARARQGGMKMMEALSIARDVENALIEKQFSNINASIPPAAMSVFQELGAETERHRRKIAEELDREKKHPG